MKKNFLILIALLCSTVGQAKFLKAVLYFTDGTNKTGLAKLVEDDDSKVTFRANEDAKSEKIPSTDLTTIVYTTESGSIFTMEHLYLTSAGIFSGKFSNSKKSIGLKLYILKNLKSVKFLIKETPEEILSDQLVLLISLEKKIQII